MEEGGGRWLVLTKSAPHWDWLVDDERPGKIRGTNLMVQSLRIKHIIIHDLNLQPPILLLRKVLNQLVQLRAPHSIRTVHDDAPFPGMTPAQWHRVIDVSLHGFFNVTQPLLMPMIGTSN